MSTKPKRKTQKRSKRSEEKWRKKKPRQKKELKRRVKSAVKKSRKPTKRVEKKSAKHIKPSSKRSEKRKTPTPKKSIRRKLTPAQRGWETRRAHEIQRQIEAEARSLRAKKGWETRRFRDLQRQHKERTQREKEIDRQRKSTDKANLKWEAVRGAIKFGTDEINRKAIVDMIAYLKSLGVRAFRFVRQVPATPSYPKGVASTQWLDLKSYDKRAINNLIGSMMQPGIDFVRHMLILDSDVPKLPPPMRDRAYEAIVEAGREVRKKKPRIHKRKGRERDRMPLFTEAEDRGLD